MSRPIFHRRRAENASTLMLALWALLLISAVLLAWIAVLGRGVDALGERNRGLEARALAHSGLAVALHPGIGPGSPRLHAEPAPGQSWRVTIRSEGGRLNVNYLLSGDEPERVDFFKRYLASRGLSYQECETLADNLREWINPPRHGPRRPNAAPESPVYQPPHRPLPSLDELRAVAGSAPLVAQSGWRDDLTLYSAGPLDIESAPARLLALVPGIGEARAARFAELRERLREERQRPDGKPFQSFEEALSCLGLGQQEFAQLAPLLGFRDPVVRIESIGQSQNVIRQVDVIARKMPGAKPQILSRNER